MLTPVAPLDTQFTRLAGLADGWLDGRGKALNPATLTAARGFLDLLAAHGLPVPHCYPHGGRLRARRVVYEGEA